MRLHRGHCIHKILFTSSGGRKTVKADAENHIVDICVGQDISDRDLQFAPQPPQFNLGKSRKNYSPLGPWLTDDPIVNICDAISYLSAMIELLLGGADGSRKPPVFLKAGDVLVSPTSLARPSEFACPEVHGQRAPGEYAF